MFSVSYLFQWKYNAKKKSRRGNLIRVELVVVFAKENVVGTGTVGIADCFTRFVSKFNHETVLRFLGRLFLFPNEQVGEVCRGVRHTPFGLDSEEHPHPAPSDFEEHEDEKTAFGFRKPCETRHHAPQPRETK